MSKLFNISSLYGSRKGFKSVKQEIEELQGIIFKLLNEGQVLEKENEKIMQANIKFAHGYALDMLKYENQMKVLQDEIKVLQHQKYILEKLVISYQCVYGDINGK